MGMIFHGSDHHPSEPCHTCRTCGQSVHTVVREVVREVPKVVPIATPDLTRFTVVDRIDLNKHSIVRVVYPDVDNYDGLKIMVFETAVLDQAIAKGRIDPHFLEWWPSPIARFEPTAVGAQLAVKFVTDVLEA